ncbi:hypothetical protein [Coxiella endosymbiont of Ornithodoros maritimus]|uniref:hypothetical protein n=1 Tax=Coxiella endosymbiont of Ornithodoros maritimus TaxID=1656172 RepID=UPI0038996313
MGILLSRIKRLQEGLIEKHIGQIAIPLTLVGSCVIDGTLCSGQAHYIPVATLEGTLRLSMSRVFTRLPNAVWHSQTQNI